MKQIIRITIQKIRQAILKTTGLTVYRNLPIGIEPLRDLKSDFKNYQFHTFFDVGANVGQTALHFKRLYPKSVIWCFEPVKKTYEVLKSNTANKHIKCHQIALGAKAMTQDIEVHKDNIDSTMNSLINPTRFDNKQTKNESIQVQTLDLFCNEKSISSIDYLKIDTEGYDLEVLKGGVQNLTKQSISFIEVEVSMNPENTYHVNFIEVKNYLERFDYRIYGIYDQVHEWQTLKPILRRANILFVAKRTYDLYKIKL
ncbi:FkbM family methyltransferase [Flammeovirgaceae bacterium SG7u.111]|nr:FkbM family methyltransferase [Flammeovirgaceae bacterium SG7u.132]WPO34531.1 FkbM family methyltransferase [Flammeovirgaceae bacterium SG7u.111]